MTELLRELRPDHIIVDYSDELADMLRLDTSIGAALRRTYSSLGLYAILNRAGGTVSGKSGLHVVGSTPRIIKNVDNLQANKRRILDTASNYTPSDRAYINNALEHIIDHTIPGFRLGTPFPDAVTGITKYFADMSTDNYLARQTDENPTVASLAEVNLVPVNITPSQ